MANKWERLELAKKALPGKTMKDVVAAGYLTWQEVREILEIQVSYGSKLSQTIGMAVLCVVFGGFLLVLLGLRA